MSTAQQTPPTGPRMSEGTAKMVLLVGSVVGLVLVAVGVVLTAHWWGVIVGGIEEWHKQWWKLLLCEVCVFGGLAVMFVGLGMARGEERTNPGMRRLLYGYNAGLSCLLLLAILAQLNVMAYLPLWPFTKVHATYDWTESSIYTLSPQSRDFLRKLNQPVKVYVLLPTGARFEQRELSTLLDNCRAVTNKIDAEFVAVDRSPLAVASLEQKYQLPEREGMLVVYGPEGNQKSEFLRYDDLFGVEESSFRDPNKKPRVEFKGESALIRTLSYLAEGKTHPVIYFTQGEGELDLNNTDATRDDTGLGRLRDRLSRANFEVKELRFGPGTDKVPDDAAVVVIARPRNQFTQTALNALRDYVKPKDPKAKKGKLIVLMDVIPTPDGTMGHTGLEGFLQTEFGVQVGDDRLISVLAPTGNPLDLPVLAPEGTRNPVVARFQEQEVPLHDIRTVQPGGSGAPPNPNYRGEPILETDPRFLIIKEPNLNVDVRDLVRSLAKPDRRAELRQKVSQEPLSVAVAVTEQGAPPDPSDPHAFMHREQLPRALVFGDATWVSNRYMGENGLFDVFSASLAWLRDKPNVAGAAEPKERKAYVIRAGNPAEIYWNLFSLPALLIGFAVVGLGAGVWVVRRR